MPDLPPKTNEGFPSARLAWQIGAATLCRLFLNTARRFAYPFAPVLGRGMGVSLTAVTSMIAVNQFTGLLSLLFAPLADARGYRHMMLLGLGLLAGGMLLGGIFPFYATVMAALFLAGLGKSIFDPALQAHVGRVVPYERRGRVIGIIETSWAGSSLVGIPLVALMIEGLGWRSPFFILGGFGVLSALGLAILIPPEPRPQGAGQRPLQYLGAWRSLIGHRPALGAVCLAFCNSAANDNLFVVYGVWLEKDFELGIVALGMVTAVIGVAELMGEGLTAFLADRLGLRRLVFAGTALAGLSYLLLPLMGRTIPLALTALFLVFVVVEFTIVTTISLLTEVLPEARATMMSGHMAAASLGRICGAFIGGPVWLGGGIMATGIVSALISALGLIAIFWGLRHWRPTGRP